MEVVNENANRRDLVRPVFIIGAPRSATSALGWAIGQHPNIQPMPETAWIASLAIGGYLSYVKGSERGKFSHLSNVDYPLEPFMERLGDYVDGVVHDVFDARCQRFYGDFRETGKLRASPNSPNPQLRLLRSIDDPKRRWIDGTPLNSQFIWILAKMFPEARFIHNLRQPDEVITSLEGFAKVGAKSQSLRKGVATWFQHAENAWYAEQAYGAGKVFRADFHRVTKEPEGLLRDVLSFLGEAYSSDCLLPLKRRLNSSEVDEKREVNRAKLGRVLGYKKAEKLYDHIVSSEVPSATDEKAEDVLKQRFLDYCHGRSLL